MAFVTSMFVMSVATFLLTLVDDLIQRSQIIERSDHFYSSAESAFEAALFHKTIRGPGWGVDSSSTVNKLELDGIITSATWEIESSSSPVILSLGEGGTLEVPFYWDQGSAEDEPNKEDLVTNLSTQTFRLEIEPIEGLDKVVVDENSAFQDVPVVEWEFSRLHNTKGYQTFVPGSWNNSGTNFSDARDCNSNNEDVNICTTDFNSGLAQLLELSPTTVIGAALPQEEQEITLADFLNNGSSSEFTFRVRPSIPFARTDEISGETFKIPPLEVSFCLISGTYCSTNSSEALPRPVYTVKTTVQGDGFDQNLTIDLAEQTSIGALGYVILGE